MKSSPQKRNWSQYNQRLKHQARIDVYVSDDLFTAYDGQRLPGGVLRYSDALIEACLLVREYFHLGLRQTQGFMESLAVQLGIEGRVPDYTTLCRRAKGLAVELLPRLRRGMVIAIDSTGLSLLSSDSWNRHKHRRKRGNYSWHKLHLALDTDTGDIVSCVGSPATVNDCQLLPALLQQAPLDEADITAICADMAYDTVPCRRAIYDRGARQRIPPKASAVPTDQRKVTAPPEHRPILEERDNALYYMQHNRINGSDALARKRWKELTGYHRRSLAETAMSRIKAHSGNSLKARIPANQSTECRIKCKLLNKLNQLP